MSDSVIGGCLGMICTYVQGDWLCLNTHASTLWYPRGKVCFMSGTFVGIRVQWSCGLKTKRNEYFNLITRGEKL